MGGGRGGFLGGCARRGSLRVAAFGRVLRQGPLSVAAFGRVLRTLGGKNIGKCRLRAHQHPLLPPLPNLRRARPHATSKARRVLGCAMERVLGGCAEGLCWWFVLKMGYSLHRFLISGPDLRIAARFYPFMPSCVHRFLNSSPDLRIDARFSPETAQRLHRFLISCPDLRIDAAFCLETPSSVQ